MNVPARAAYNSPMPISLARRPRPGHLTGLTALALSCLVACSGKTEMVKVPVVGLPCSGPGQSLVHPIIMQATHAKGTLSMTYTGPFSDGKPTTVDLAKDTRHALAVKFGVCANVNCTDPRWIQAEQQVQVDTSKPSPALTVAVPGDHACVTAP